MNKKIRELLVLHFLNDGVRTIFTTFLPFIAKDLSLTLSQVGFLGSSQPLIASILALPTGFFAHRLGGFHVLIYLLLIYSFGALGVFAAYDIWMLVFAFLLGAVGFGMFHTIGFSLIAKNSAHNKIGRNMGDFTSIGEIGRIALPPLAVFASTFIGWRITMVLVAGIGVSAFIYFRFFQRTKEDYSFASTKESPAIFFKTMLELLRIKVFRLVLLTGIIDSLASSAMYIYLPFLLLGKGITITEFGIVIAAYFFGSLVGKTLLGRSVDKLGNIKVFIGSEISMAVVLLLLLFISGFFPLLILSFLLGGFTKGTSPIVQSLFSHVAHSSHYDRIYAVSELAIGLSAVATIIAMGFIAQDFGIQYVFYLSAFFALLAIAPVIPYLKSGVIRSEEHS